MTMLSRYPRQIVAFKVDISVKSSLIQEMVDSVATFKTNYTDGASVYKDIDFVDGKCKQNYENKRDTHLIEGSNADLRHYIAGLRRKSRCFFRKLESLKAVLYLFINAYNKFGEAKLEYANRYYKRYKDRIDYPFSHLDFI